MRNIDPDRPVARHGVLFGVVFVLIEAPGQRLDRSRSSLSLVVAAAGPGRPSCRYESRRHDPFIDLRFFRSIPFASATVIAVCAFAAWGAFLFMMSLYLQGERGYSADAHRPDLPAVRHRRADLLAAVGPPGRPLRCAPVAARGRRPDHHGVGVAVVPDRDARRSGSSWRSSRSSASASRMVNAPITNAAVSGMPLDRAGAASAVASTSRQVGVSIGVALCGSVAGAAHRGTGSGLRRRRRGRCGWYAPDSASSCSRARVVLDVAAGAALGRAAGAADRRTGCEDQVDVCA